MDDSLGQGGGMAVATSAAGGRLGTCDTELPAGSVAGGAEVRR